MKRCHGPLKSCTGIHLMQLKKCLRPGHLFALKAMTSCAKFGRQSAAPAPCFADAKSLESIENDLQFFFGDFPSADSVVPAYRIWFESHGLLAGEELWRTYCTGVQGFPFISRIWYFIVAVAGHEGTQYWCSEFRSWSCSWEAWTQAVSKSHFKAFPC